MNRRKLLITREVRQSVTPLWTRAVLPSAPVTEMAFMHAIQSRDVARKLKQKMLAALPAKFDPNFIDRLSRRYALARVVIGRRAALEAHLGGAEHLSYVQRALIKRTLWLELLTERYEQQVANGEAVDVGALSQLNNTLKGLYKDLGITAAARTVKRLHEHLVGAKPTNGAKAEAL